jgi:hypothetical protein
VSEDVENDLASAQLDRILDQYKGMPEAIQLRKQMALFRKLISAKNQAMIAEAAAIVEYFRLESAIDQIQAESARVQKIFTENYDPTVAAVQAYMRKSYSDSKEFLMRAIYDMNKAYEYWSCMESKLRFETGTLAELGSSYVVLKERVKDAWKRIGPGQQSESELTFSLEELSGSDQISRFRKSGIANFSISLDQWEFTKRYNAFVREIRIRVLGAETSDDILTVAIAHSGVAERIGPTGERRTFQIDPQPLRFKYDLKHPDKILSRANFGGENPGEFIAVSPATSWRIVADNTYNVAPNYSKVTDISIEFDISYNQRM